MSRWAVFVPAVLSLFVPLALVGAEKGKPVLPFNGTDLKGWKLKGDEKKSNWVVGRAVLDDKDPKKLAVTPVPPQADGGPAGRQLVNAKGGGVDVYTEEKFGACTIELEFMVSQGSNSGIYVLGEYEVQILDSFGKAADKLNQGDLGALYSAAAPKINASKKPGEWQKFVIDFQPPRFEDGKKVANARFVKVALNDQVLHENVEMKGPTPSGVTGKEGPTGPLMFQGDHGPVAFRNITITPK